MNWEGGVWGRWRRVGGGGGYVETGWDLRLYTRCEGGEGEREERRMKANSLTLVYFSSYNEIHLQCMHLRKCEKAAR